MRILKWLAAILVPPVLVLVVFVVSFGMRVEFAGSGWPRVAFGPDPEEQAEVIARHRAAQRAQAGQPPTMASNPSAPDPAGPGQPSAPSVAAAPEPAAPVPAPRRPYWTDFRGPRRDGHYRERPVRTTWPSGGLQPLWKQPSGAGYASFVVGSGYAFTIEQRGPDEVVAAYDIATGRERWTHPWTALFRETMGGDGPRATPTWSDGTVYALGATGELRAIDASSGALVWRVNILEDNGARNLDWGMAAAPLVVGDTVVVAPGGPNGRSVVAYDRRTGARVWATGTEKAGYSSPMLATLAGREQLLVFTAHGLVALTPDRGERLWFHPWRTQADINAAQPLVIGDARVFISSGYGVGAAVLEVSRDGDTYAVREVWRNNRMKNRFASSVLLEGFIYGLDESIMACVNADTGELTWKGGRYGYGQILAASGRLIVLTEAGDLVLVATNPERHEELARFSALDGKTWNHAAIDDGVLLVRNLREMAAFDLRP